MNSEWTVLRNTHLYGRGGRVTWPVAMAIHYQSTVGTKWGSQVNISPSEFQHSGGEPRCGEHNGTFAMISGMPHFPLFVVCGQMTIRPFWPYLAICGHLAIKGVLWEWTECCHAQNCKGFFAASSKTIFSSPAEKGKWILQQHPNSSLIIMTLSEMMSVCCNTWLDGQ